MVKLYIRKSYKTKKHSVRKSKYSDFGWEPIGKGDLYRCIEIKHCADGMRRCIYTCRKQNIESHIKNKRHIFSLAAKDDPGFKEKSEFESVYVIRRLIRERSAYIAAKCGIPSNVICSKHFCNFLAEIIELSKNIPSSISGSTIIGHPYKKEIQAMISDHAKHIQEKSLNELKNVEFVSLLADAGTINNLKIIHFILVNPFTERHVVYNTILNNNFTSVDYQEAFQSMLVSITSENLTVTSIVIDNLRAQMLGAHNAIEFLGSEFNATLIIPCFCHMINLVFVSAKNQSTELSNLIEDIQSFAQMLRKNQAVTYLNVKCPKICSTRWLYIVDILFFILNNVTNINEYLVFLETMGESCVHNKVPDEYADLYLILLPLKILSLLFERRSTRLYQVIPHIKSAMNYYRTNFKFLRTDSGIRVFDLIVSNLLARLKTNARDEAVAAYSLTINGLKDIRLENSFRAENRQYFNNINEKDEFMALLIDYQKSIDFHISIYHIMTERTSDNEGNSSKVKNKTIDQYFTKEKDLQVNEEEEDIGAEEEAVESFLTQDEEIDEDNNFNQILDFISNLSREDMLNYNPYNDSTTYYMCALGKISSIASFLNINCEYIEEMFSTYCYTDPLNFRDINLLESDDPNQFWKNISSYDSRWFNFCRVSLRLLNVSVAEAEVERAFSTDRKIMMNCYRWSLETLHNHLIIRNQGE